MRRPKASATARGYDHRHRKERDRWKPAVAAGQVACARCGRPILPGMLWDLGHAPDRQSWSGPEHRYCNRSEGATRGNRARGARSRLVRALVGNPSRQW